MAGNFSSSKFKKKHFFLSRFRIDNTDHIVDVKLGNRMNIFCPFPIESTDDGSNFVIYVVNKEEYDTCRILSDSPRTIGECRNSKKPLYYTLTFRQFSPIPGAIDYKPGNDYYFMAASGDKDKHQKVDALCRDYNMKIIIKVNGGRIPPKIPPTPKPPIPRAKENDPKRAKQNRNKLENGEPRPYDYYLDKMSKESDVALNDIPDSGKKRNRPRKEKNKHVKQEASTSNAAKLLLLCKLSFSAPTLLMIMILVK